MLIKEWFHDWQGFFLFFDKSQSMTFRLVAISSLDSIGKESLVEVEDLGGNVSRGSSKKPE